jgi:hypothetical protein
MKVGFTGTRHGCSPAQLAALERQLNSMPMAEFHHGDCLGADAQAHAIVVDRVWVVIYPSNIPRSRAYCIGACRTYPPKPPLERNSDIVKCTDVLVACPNGMYEEQRSGTWATIRYARAAKRKIIIVWPNGEVKEDAY